MARDAATYTTTLPALAAGDTGYVETPPMSANTRGSLAYLLVSSSVPYKAEVGVFNTRTGWLKKAAGVSPLGDWWWKAPGTDFEIRTELLDVKRTFRTYVSNLDPSLTADFYVTFYWYEGG